jgi:hypothetical protein
VKRRKGRRHLASSENLPVTTHVYELSTEERDCPCCGVERKEIGQEKSGQIEHIRGSFVGYRWRLLDASAAAAATAVRPFPSLVTRQPPPDSIPLRDRNWQFCRYSSPHNYLCANHQPKTPLQLMRAFPCNGPVCMGYSFGFIYLTTSKVRVLGAGIQLT